MIRNFLFGSFFLFTLVSYGQISKISDFAVDQVLKYSDYNNVGVVDSFYFFTLNTPAEGTELWVTNGTKAGTRLVKDINPGTKSSDVGTFTTHKGKLYFFATTAANGYELWTSDGTTTGTKMVKDINPAGGIISSNAFSELFSDGNLLYFGAVTPGFGEEPWISDGTAAGTKLLKEVQAGAAGSSPERFFSFKNKVYFFAITDVFKGAELWETTGTAESTKPVKVLNETGATNLCTALDVNSSMFYFMMNKGFGDQLWKSDGTAANTQLVSELSESTQDLVLLENNKAIFSLKGGDNLDDVWVSDGTAAGTVVLKDLNYFFKKTPFSIIEWEGSAYILANDEDDLLLLKTDGTLAGTSTIGKFTTSTSSGPQFLVPLSKEFIIVAYKDYETGSEIFTSKGTSASTKLLVDLNPVIAKSSNPADFKELYNGNVIFKGEEIQDDKQLFYYDRYVPATLSISTQKSIPCYGDSTGRIKVVATGGLPPYSYLWSQGSTSDVIDSLPAGTYMVTVTDKLNKTTSKSFVLSQPDSLKVSASIKSEDQGMMNGKITLTISGGTSPYAYKWSHGSTIKSPSNLKAGDYSVTISDANECSYEYKFTVPIISGTSDENNCTLNIAIVQNDLDISVCESGKLKIFDFHGRTIVTHDLTSTETRIDISNLPNGVYMSTFIPTNQHLISTTKFCITR